MCRQKGRNEYEAQQKETLVDGNLVLAGIPAVDGAVFLSMGLFLLYRYAVDRADRRREDRNGIQ